jgi:hypothetical protein
MHFFEHTKSLINQLQSVLDQLQPDHYYQKLTVLHGSSVGQHVRHVIEFFEELEKGYKAGTINYDNRQRRLLLETDKAAAATNLRFILDLLPKEDKPLQLVIAFDDDPSQTFIVGTTYYREVIYNMEHVVHHMAMIKTGVQCFKGISLPSSFGIAASTKRFMAACAQ